MTKEELAAKLHGRQYRLEMEPHEEKSAKQSGLVVVFGASDDLTEFRGCLYDEKGNWEGGKIYFRDGDIANGDDVSEDELDFSELEKLPKINAIWCPRDNDQVFASWAFETEIPHATFDIFEDGELYCRGIVFDYSSIS